MNILYICADPGIPIRGAKGASIHVRAMIDAFAALGHRVTLITPRAGDGIAPNAQVVEVASRLFDTKNLSADTREFLAMQIADASVRAGLALIAREQVTLIYERYSLWSDAGARLAAVTGLPFVLEVNAPLRVEAARYRTLSRDRDAAEIEMRMLTQADAISVVSAPLRDYVIQRGASPEHVHVLPNAVDEQYFHPAVSGDAVRAQLGLADKFVVGFVGTVKPWHDLDILIEAVAQTAARDPFAARGSAPHLLLVGDIPDAVRARIAERGIAATMVPPIPNHDVPAYIAAMDIAVSPHPALADFYFSPLKLVEYLACGVATIAANLPPIAEFVTDGVNARLYPPGDAAALAAQIAELAAHDAARTQLGWQGARYVLQNHTWRRNAHQVLGWLFPHTSARDPLGTPLFDDKLRRRLFRATRADLAGHWLAAQVDERFPAVTRLEILKYKPRRRCVIAYELTRSSAAPGENATRHIIGKVFKDGRGAEHLDFHRALWANGFGATAGDGITIAQPLAYIPAMQMFVQERAPGATLDDSLNTPDFSARVRASAVAIAKLHKTRVQPPKTYALADELAHLAEWAADLATHKPDYAYAIERQLAALNAWANILPPVELAPAHRDFYYSQLLFADWRITLIDLDLFARADPAIDVANFAAHLRFLALTHFANAHALDQEVAAFVDEYARRQSVTPEFFARLAFYETATYFRLMHVVVQRPQFADLFLPLFELTSEHILGQASPRAVPVPHHA
ncbi:MAG: glycosyltransferase [Chloroflexi bacterium]|nr:glycosyltransferase [Chloroflexota bacterium]